MIDDEEVERLARSARIAEQELPQIFDSIDRIRKIGYADGNSTGDGVWSIAMPMPGLRVPTVLGLTGPENDVRSRLPQICDAMRSAIDRWTQPVQEK
jgi:hypothetical protein